MKIGENLIDMCEFGCSMPKQPLQLKCSWGAVPGVRIYSDRSIGIALLLVCGVCRHRYLSYLLTGNCICGPYTDENVSISYERRRKFLPLWLSMYKVMCADC